MGNYPQTSPSSVRSDAGSPGTRHRHLKVDEDVVRLLILLRSNWNFDRAANHRWLVAFNFAVVRT